MTFDTQKKSLEIYLNANNLSNRFIGTFHITSMRVNKSSVYSKRYILKARLNNKLKEMRSDLSQHIYHLNTKVKIR